MTDRTNGIATIQVLVVENDSETRDAHVRNLERWGYRPVIVTGEGNHLIEDAINKSRTQKCHLAIVDKRLFDDKDPDDKRGIQLIKKLRPTISIIVTGFPSHEDTRKALREVGAFDVISKNEGPKAVRKALQEAVEEYWPQVIIGPGDWSEQFIQSLVGDLTELEKQSAIEEVCYLIARIFKGHESITLHPISTLTGWRTPGSGNVARRNSVVLFATPDKKNTCVIKIASKERTKQEVDNYENFIHQQLGGNQYLIREGTETLWRFGVSQYYTFGSGKLQTLTQRYHSYTPESINGALITFFTVVWKPHFRRGPISHNNDLRAKNSNRENLFEMYDQLWRYKERERGVLSDAVKKYQNEPAPNSVIELLGPSFTNPFHWLQKHSQRHLPHLREYIIHGDLHGDNLLIDDQNHPWPIDFERTGWGHVATDFVEMEHDILTRMLKVNKLEEFYHLAIVLTRPHGPNQNESEWIATPVIRKNPELKKAFTVIRGLRQIAWDLDAWDVRYDAYYLGVFFNTIFVLRTLLEENRQDEERYARVYLLSVILCERLRHWDMQGMNWPPPELNWPSVGLTENIHVVEPEKIKILFVAANPTDTKQLALTEEFRIIERKIRESDARHAIELIPVLAARFDDLQREMNRHMPDIVHFSGHGDDTGEILFSNDKSGVSQPVRPETLRRLFETAGDNVRLVFLNACYTYEQADAISNVVDFTIGMSHEWGDEAAVAFAAKFYEMVGLRRRSIQNCFDQAKLALDVFNTPETDVPILLAKNDLDPTQAHLLKPLAGEQSHA